MDALSVLEVNAVTPPKSELAHDIAPARSIESRRPVMRLVEAPPYYHEDVELYRGDVEENSHSLHHAFQYPDSMRPEIAAFMIQRYSKKGDVVLDPFCGSGTVALEANLAGRIAYASDVHPLAVAVTKAKLDPADLAEVTLALQGLPLRRPVELGPYGDIFRHFYDTETFREIANLRAVLTSRDDRISRFLSFVALSILHGSSAGYLSVYSSPHAALTPQEQAELNLRRSQVPDYRALMPRLLRKTASILRDGVASSMRQLAVNNYITQCDARHLSYVPNQSVDLAICKPPVPEKSAWLSDLWLKSWFLGLQARPVAEAVWQGDTVAPWLDYMNESLIELARVVRSGGRASLILRDVGAGRTSAALYPELVEMLQTNLHRFWNVECVLQHRDRTGTVAGVQRTKRAGGNTHEVAALILRRR